jgi:hypothetical protein
LLSDVVTYLLGVALATRSESSLAIQAAGPSVLGLGMTKYEQNASLIHAGSLRRLSA